jgi:hypothetical protein
MKATRSRAREKFYTKPRSQQYLRTKIRRLEKEILDIDEFFYRPEEVRDLDQHASMLERKRDDVVRSVVLQMHTAIEDILNSLIAHRAMNAESTTRKAKLRSTRGKALSAMLFGGGSLGFEMKLNLAVVHRVVTARVRDRLLILNKLRNKCSHNWLIKVPVRHGRRPRQKKRPLLLYEDGDLHRPEVLRQFLGEYGPLYAKLFVKLVN